MTRATNPGDGRADRAPAPGDVPNEEAAVEEFPHARDVPLKEQTSLVDEHGTDIRQYTGEPVDTEEGPVVPQQMAVGSQRVVGGGEFPHAPPRGTGEGAEEPDQSAESGPSS
jgi:hypothetical protein